ncbi:MAG: hypothetical protein RXR08_10855 [Sulfolobaceae archaeon]
MDKEEETRAIRGALMAELDAINYYLQQGRLFNKEFIKFSIIPQTARIFSINAIQDLIL